MNSRSRSLDPNGESRRARALFSAAFMSDTKWRELIEAVREASSDRMQARVKFVGTEEVREISFPPSLACPHAYADTIEFGPIELRTIEWLELPTDITPMMASIGQFPLEVADGRTRVVGYSHPIE